MFAREIHDLPNAACGIAIEITGIVTHQGTDVVSHLTALTHYVNHTAVLCGIFTVASDPNILYFIPTHMPLPWPHFADALHGALDSVFRGNQRLEFDRQPVSVS